MSAESRPLASFRAPKRNDRCFFSSGRAALLYLLRSLPEAHRKLLLPSIGCPSLVGAITKRFPDIEVEFYPVNLALEARFPNNLPQEAMLVITHFFGYHSAGPTLPAGQIIEDWSHVLLAPPAQVAENVFASYRKLYPVSDGGVLFQQATVEYESEDPVRRRKRNEASSWNARQEAERALDADPRVSDISSQSLFTVLTSSQSRMRSVRTRNEAILRSGLNCGRPLRPFRAEECPLAHIRVFDTQDERDRLRRRLMDRGVYTSVQWPASDHLPQGSSLRDTAIAWERSHIAFPVGDQLSEADMLRIVRTAAEAC